MKKMITMIMAITLMLLSVVPAYAAGDRDLNFANDWTGNQALSAPGINNGTKFDGEKPSDFASRTEYEDFMYNKYGKTERKKLNPKKYSRLLQTEDGEVFDFRQSEATEKANFIKYKLPILESLANTQDKADNLANAVNRAAH